MPHPKNPDDHNHIHGDVTIDPRSGALVPDDVLKIGSRWFYPMHYRLYWAWKDVGYWIGGHHAGGAGDRGDHGRVRVARAERDAGDRQTNTRAWVGFGYPVELSAGQTVVADDSGRIGPVACEANADIVLWRKGRIDARPSHR
ncbi:MAG: hypothetical protein ACFCUJ_01285 [Thiotrichales bacterium]